ncbi:MAG TPA: hypothetical protein VGH28_15280 [Polyangiaceae bacterium]|jgi:hypothetical protein
MTGRLLTSMLALSIGCSGGGDVPADAAADEGAPFDAATHDAPADQQSADAGPKLPTRDQVLSVALTFQGLTVTLPTYGAIPWFEPAISSLDASSRQIVYQAKHAAGDTHLALSISWAYMNDGNYSYPVPGKDLTGDLPSFRALVAEVIQNGFTPIVFLAGDGESPSGGGYNDPNGWSYGYGWLTAHLPAIVAALQSPTDLTPFCIFIPGWDGVTPVWQPSEISAYLLQARSLLPNGYLGLEIAAGAADSGGGAADYQSPAGQALDVVLQEFPGPPTGDITWQPAARELGPAYVRPPDQSSGDDPNPPFELSGGTPRGPWFAIAYEFDEYRWVRNAVSTADVATERQYLHAMGYAHVN